MAQYQLKLETQGTDLILTREFDAPREKVFEAHADCKHLKNWWGPRAWPLSFCRIDFRPGGRWHFCMGGPDSMEAWGLAIFQEIKAPSLLVYQDSFSDKDGNITSELPSTIVRMEFLEEAGKTIVRSTARYASQEDLQKILDMGMESGTAETFDRLDEYLKKM